MPTSCATTIAYVGDIVTCILDNVMIKSKAGLETRAVHGCFVTCGLVFGLDQIVDESPFFHYLGVRLDDVLIWTHHVERLEPMPTS